MNPIKFLVGAFFALAAPALLIAAGWWLAVDRPAVAIGPCPFCLRLAAGDGVQLRALEAAETAAGRRAVAVNRQTAQISAAAGAAEAAAQTRIVTVTRTLIREVPSVVTPQIDRDFPLPVGFLRVHDAAARGLDLPDLPDPAGRPDDAASGVAASDAAGAIAANYGACRADDEQLAALQAWLKAELAAGKVAP